MSLSITELEAFARQLGCDLQLSPSVLEKLSKTTLVMVGYGSIARPLSELLADLACRRFTLIDPKGYAGASVASQCEPDEVGLQKVSVGQKRLSQRGAAVQAYDRDAYSVPDGVVLADAIIVTSVDNRRADLRANRLATRMRTRLVKLNVEPRYGLVSVRAYDFRFASLICLECQVSDRQYREQRHPRSCDGPGEGRSTNSPRSLSQAAGQVGAVAVLQLLAGEAQAAPWYGHELQFFTETAQVQRSQLMPKEGCRWDHSAYWPNVERLNVGPMEMTLEQLLEVPSRGFDGSVELRFCHPVAFEGRCNRCGALVARPRWIAELESTAGRCPQCGGAVAAIPYHSTSHLRAERLRPVLQLPLSDWGVEPGAVIQVHREGQSKTYVLPVGESSRHTPCAAAHGTRSVPATLTSHQPSGDPP